MAQSSGKPVYDPAHRATELPRLPRWLRRPMPAGTAYQETKLALRRFALHTVCEEAQCPNIGECFNRHVATFLILGSVCTRRCAFCAIEKGKPAPPDPLEPEHLAEAAVTLRLRHIVVTSVNRDDLQDDGAGQFCQVIRALRARAPGCVIEILTPDFRGRQRCLTLFADHLPDIWAHNLETVPRLYRAVRIGSKYERSLDVLRSIRRLFPQITTKSGIMLGLGETREEVVGVLEDMRSCGVTMCTIGQYLRPSPAHHPVVEFIHPDVFADYAQLAYTMGFESVLSEPFARSSYHADGKETPRNTQCAV